MEKIMKKILENIKEFFLGMNNKFQKLGTAILILALVLLFIKAITLCYIALGAVLLIDLWLVFKKDKTITQWFRPWLPKWMDYILTVGIIVLFVWLHSPVAGLYILIGTINGHLNGDW
jgi:hypothetical protein